MPCFAAFAVSIGLLAVDDSETLSQHAQAIKCTWDSTEKIRDNDNPWRPTRSFGRFFEDRISKGCN